LQYVDSYMTENKAWNKSIELCIAYYFNECFWKADTIRKPIVEKFFFVPNHCQCRDEILKELFFFVVKEYVYPEQYSSKVCDYLCNSVLEV